MISKVIEKGWLEDDLKKLQKELKGTKEYVLAQEELIEELFSQIETKDELIYQEQLPLFDASTPHEEFMNAIIKYGVVNSCEWFGYEADSEFTWITIDVLNERLSEQGKEVE